MIELLGDHALPLFREFKMQWQHFESMDQLDKLKTSCKTKGPEASYLPAHHRQLKKIRTLNENITPG